MAQQTQINGNRYSFTSISLQIGDRELPKGVFTSINYDAAQEPGLVQGNQVTPVGRTSGYGMGTGSWEMLVSEWDDLVDYLTSQGFYSIMEIDFDLVVSYSVNDIDVRTDLLRGVRITRIGSANQQGTDATKKVCDLSIMRISLNGIEAYADPA